MWAVWQSSVRITIWAKYWPGSLGHFVQQSQLAVVVSGKPVRDHKTKKFVTYHVHFWDGVDARYVDAHSYDDWKTWGNKVQSVTLKVREGTAARWMCAHQTMQTMMFNSHVRFCIVEDVCNSEEWISPVHMIPIFLVKSPTLDQRRTCCIICTCWTTLMNICNRFSLSFCCSESVHKTASKEQLLSAYACETTQGGKCTRPF